MKTVEKKDHKVKKLSLSDIKVETISTNKDKSRKNDESWKYASDTGGYSCCTSKTD